MISERDKKFVTSIVDGFKKKCDAIESRRGWHFRHMRHSVPALCVLYVTFFVGLGLFFTQVVNIGNFALLTTFILTPVFAYGTPQLFHLLRGKFNGKLGRVTVEEDVTDYLITFKDLMKEKLFKKILKNRKNIDKLTEDDVEELKRRLDNVTYNAAVKLDELTLKRISSRKNRDMKKINKLLQNYSHKNEARITAKINKIIERNDKFVKPWADLYDKCIKDLLTVAEFMKKWDDDYEIPDNLYYSMNRNLLRDSVAEKLESITGRNFNQSEINSFNFEKYPSKTKPTTFEQLRTYLMEKHHKNESSTPKAEENEFVL